MAWYSHVLIILAVIMPRQQVYLVKQVVPGASRCLVLSQDPEGSVETARWTVAGPSYGLQVTSARVKSMRKASKVLDRHMVEPYPDVIVLADEKIFRDAMLIRLITNRAENVGAAVVATSAQQVIQGATFAFEQGEDGIIRGWYNPIALKRIGRKIPPNLALPFEPVESD